MTGYCLNQPKSLSDYESVLPLLLATVQIRSHYRDVKNFDIFGLEKLSFSYCAYYMCKMLHMHTVYRLISKPKEFPKKLTIPHPPTPDLSSLMPILDVQSRFSCAGASNLSSKSEKTSQIKVTQLRHGGKGRGVCFETCAMECNLEFVVKRELGVLKEIWCLAGFPGSGIRNQKYLGELELLLFPGVTPVPSQG